MNPELDARLQVQLCREAQSRNLDLVPYCGPEATLRRFQVGEIVTKAQVLTDQSLWIVEPIHHRAMERLKWMVGL